MASSNDRPLQGPSRRRLLQGGAAAMGAAALTGPLAFLHTKGLAYGYKGNSDLCGTRTDSPYGPLFPTADRATGLELLMLPRGFKYTTISWRGDIMHDGNLVPSGHDGMAVVDEGGRRGRSKRIKLIRNHENFFGPDGDDVPIAPNFNYDSQGGGGTTVLEWRAGELYDHRVSISGTIANCAGGRTPWGSWLTCEEQIADGDEPHGYVFESTVDRVTNPTPLIAMGRFSHEAVAFDPRDGEVYLTEDNSSVLTGDTSSRNRGNSGFYRFEPNRPLRGEGSLEAGGRLYMLQARDRKTGAIVDDLRDPECFASYDVEWIRIDNPNAGPMNNGSGPYNEGRSKGATRFQRCEGCWWDPVEENIVWVDTEGGPIGSQAGRVDRAEGAVWRYDPRKRRLTCIFVSQGALAPDAYGADNPDNVSVSETGGIILCEDGGTDDGDGLSLLGLLDDGRTFEFARNIINITAADAPALIAAGHDPNTIGVDDYSDQEFAGATFTSDCELLFVNIQTPGITFVIDGPFEKGPFGSKSRRGDDDDDDGGRGGHDDDDDGGNKGGGHGDDDDDDDGGFGPRR